MPDDQATVRRTVEIAAPPDAVWRLVSDLPAMGRWSPENRGGRWLGDVTGPAVGARFRGTNGRGPRRWSTDVRVTTCEPGRLFAFDVRALGLAVSRWSYEVRPSAAGCSLTETWEDQRGRLMHLIGVLASGVRDRAGFTATSIEATLAAVKRAAEADAGVA